MEHGPFPVQSRHCLGSSARTATSASRPTWTGTTQSELEQLRPVLAGATGRPVTFGWGPRFLHSTGQFHKGGPAQGVYLQITGNCGQDIPIPGRPFTFGELIAAQAAGDAQVLADHGRPVLRLNLLERKAGAAQLAAALTDLGGK